MPLIGSTVTPIVVFLPLISITGVTGTFFRALAMTVGTALLTSLALALTWTPTLSHYLLRRRRSEGAESADALGHVAISGFMGRVMRVYVSTLRLVPARPLILAAGCVVLVGASYLCYTHLGSDLLPEMDEGGFILDYLMPAGSSLDDTNAVLLGVEKILSETPEVEGTSRRTGLQLGLAAVTEANNGDFSVRLKRDRKRGIDEVISEIRGKVNDEYPQLDVEFIQVLQDMIGDLTSSPEPIEIKLFAADPALLKTWAPKVADKIKIEVNKKGCRLMLKDGIENTVSGLGHRNECRVPLWQRVPALRRRKIQLDASAVLQGEPVDHSRGRETITLVHPFGCVSRKARARRSTRSAIR